jgi:hypothetical protein
MQPNRHRPLLASGYIVAFLWAAFSLIDLVVRLYPLRPEATAWRVGAVGLATLTLATLLLSLFILCTTAYLLQHRLVLRGLAVLSLAGAAALLTVVPFFALDVLELRRLVPAEGHGPFDWGMGRAAVMLVLAAGAFLWIGLTGWKATAVQQKAKAAASPLFTSAGALAER